METHNLLPHVLEKVWVGNKEVNVVYKEKHNGVDRHTGNMRHVEGSVVGGDWGDVVG